MTTYHRQSTGHWAAIRAECAAILAQHSSSILATRHARQLHALQLVGVVWSWAGGGVQRVVRSRGRIVGEMGGQHVVWQGGGSDGRDVEVLIAQTTHRVWLKRDRETRLKKIQLKTPVKPHLSHSITVFLISFITLLFSFLTLHWYGTKSSSGKMGGWEMLPSAGWQLGEINKNYIGDYKRPKCHETLLSEIIDGRDGKTARHHYPRTLTPAWTTALCVMQSFFLSQNSHHRLIITDDIPSLELKALWANTHSFSNTTQ